MVDTTSFGLWLKQRRKALDLTQEALAERVGCAVTTIRKLEGGVLRPSKQIAERLANTLDLTPEERVTFVREARAAPSDHQIAEAAPPTPTLPTGTVTFLFTDIEGSTRLFELHSQSMPLALERHNTLLRHSCGSYSGVIFKTVGDAVCAAFASASDALAAALAAQRALHVEPWQDIEPLRVRMALHTGEVEARDGDYLGLPLSRVNRILGISHGGQVLLSRATQELIRDQLPSDIALRDLGEHRLKDLIRPEHIFQLIAPDLPADFPALATLDRHLTNLPIQQTPLIGREREIVAARAILEQPHVRLLILTGPGGAGKTRLALQLAAELLGAFASGVYFVPLAPIRDPELVASMIAQALEVKETGGQPLIESLKSFLRDKRMLLLLDNFEHVIAAATLIPELLTSAPGLKVLVTSRAVLHLSAEHEFVVPPLTLPDRTNLPSIERLTQYDAVRLFIERARALKPDFAVTNDNAPAVAEICHQLDGLPLAIELAAARIRLLPAQALLARLSNRLHVLTGGPRDLPARQQTLRNAIAWSYDLLEPNEQILFARVGVFVGGCTIEAAEFVCALDNDQSIDMLNGLTSLVDNSLLRAIETVGGEPRFVMLETIREYALERLSAHGEADRIQARYRGWVLQLAELAEPQLRSAEQARWLQRLELEHDNLRTVLAWSQAVEDNADIGLRLVGALWRFWFVHGYFGECHRWLESALARGRADATALRAKALFGAGVLARYQGEYARAAILSEQSLGYAREVDDRWLIAAILVVLGTTYYEQGAGERGIDLLEESLLRARAIGDAWLIAWALHTLGWRVKDQGDYRRAAILLEEGLALARLVGDQWLIAWALHTLGWSALYQSGYRQAEVLLKESLAIRQVLGDKPGIAWALESMGKVAAAQGDYATARALHERRLAIEREMGNLSGIAGSFWCLGDILLAQGDLAQAYVLHTQGLALSRELDDKRFIARSLRSLGDVILAQGDPAQALTYQTQGLVLAQELGDKAFVARSLRSLGDVGLARGEYTQSVAYYAESLAIFDSLSNRQDLPACIEGLAHVAVEQQQANRTVQLCAAAATFRQANRVPLAPADRPRYEHTLAAARAQLDEATFTTAWTAGQSLTPARTVGDI